MQGAPFSVIVMPLAEDTFHAAAYRFYRGCVLELIAEHMGESNPERTHDLLAGMFLPAVLTLTKRGLVKYRRRSTSMVSLPCDRFCAYIDRVTAWAEHPDELNLRIPMADPAWKWHAYYEELRRDTENGLGGYGCGPAGAKPAVASIE